MKQPRLTKPSAEALLQYIEARVSEEIKRATPGPYQRADAYTAVLAGLTGLLEVDAGRESTLFKLRRAT